MKYHIVSINRPTQSCIVRYIDDDGTSIDVNFSITHEMTLKTFEDMLQRSMPRQWFDTQRKKKEQGDAKFLNHLEANIGQSFKLTEEQTLTDEQLDQLMKDLVKQVTF